MAGVIEMTAKGKIISGSNFRFFEVYLALAIIYWVMTILIEQILRFLEKRFSIPDSAAGAMNRGWFSWGRREI